MVGAMRTAIVDAAARAGSDELLTTGEAAKILSVSRQHVVDLCDRGLLPFVYAGSRHRRIRRSDIEAFRAGSDRLSRDQQRSLWLAYAIAGHIVVDPEGTRERAHGALDKMEQVARGQARQWLKEWRQLLDGSVPVLLDALTDRSLRGRELRQNNPFAGAIPPDERERVLASWRAQMRAGQ